MRSLTTLALLVGAALAAPVAPLAAQAADTAHAGHHAPAADTRPTVAVMYFNNGAVGRQAEFEPLSKGLADMLITELAANPGIRVVERDQLQALLREQDLAKDGRVDQETAVRLGKILGARHMIFGGFVTDGRGAMRIQARAVDVETSRIVHTESVSGKTDDFMALVAELAEKLDRGLQLPAIPRQAPAAGAARPARLPFQLAMLYARGLTEKDSGNTERAVEYFRKVTAEFPDYEPARRELERLEQPPRDGE